MFTKRIHLIAIGGSVMHNLAIALHKKGYTITGSDDAIYEPSSSRLAQYGLLPTELGWHEEHITPDIDMIILGMHARSDNPELCKAQSLGIKIVSYPEFIYEQSKNKTRVVIGGSHGKTTITSMILHVLKQVAANFDYLVGAQLKGFDTMVSITDDASILVAEGDEYLASPIDLRPKFHVYKAHIAVISGVAWDHINVFPTYEQYLEQFSLFLKTIEPNGAVIYSADDQQLVQLIEKDTSNILKIPYTTLPNEVREGVTYLIVENQLIPLKIFGNHNLQNMNAARLVCNQLGITDQAFIAAIQSFDGAARRLELLAQNDTVHIFKDFAHSPSKLKATVKAVRQQFFHRKLTACIELHTFSSLNPDFLQQYKATLDDADTAVVFINKSTFQQKNRQPFTKETILEAFNRSDLIYFDNPDDFKAYLEHLKLENHNLLLMSSGNYGGIDVQKIANQLIK